VAMSFHWIFGDDAQSYLMG